MRQFVTSWLSYLVVGAVAAGSTAIIILYNDTQILEPLRTLNLIQSETDEEALELSDEEDIDAQGKVEAPELLPTWTLQSGDSNDTCTAPTFSGEARIRGWLVYGDNLGTSDWLFSVVPADQKKLPMYRYRLNGQDVTDVNQFVDLWEIPQELVQRVRMATPESPVTLTIKGYRLYCGGRPVVGFTELPSLPPLTDDDLGIDEE
jgi:hypothetical protein